MIRNRHSITSAVFNEPTTQDVMYQTERRPTNADVVATARTKKTADNTGLTGASALTTRQSILPCCLVTILFFLWGFAYGLLDTLNAKFQVSLHVTAARAGGLQAAYFGAYFIMPLTLSGWIVRKFGFRWTFITGLVIYGIGALCFWPSAKYESFGGFCGSLFIVGSGLSTLETSADPYLAICGPPRLSEFRLELAQSIQAVGSVIAPIIAAKAFFNVDINDLSNVQWTYLSIAIFVFLLAVVFYFAPIPEVTDADMELQAQQSSSVTGFQDKPIHKQTRLIFAVAAQFCYVSAQVAVASQFISYARNVAHLSASNASNRYAVGQACFTVGRFASAGLMLVMKPRYILLGSATAIMVFIILAIAVKGEAGLAMLTIVLFFESNIFILLLTTGIRGLGRHTKRGSSWIIAAISGGALGPSLTGLVADKKGFNIAMLVPMAFFVVSLVFSIFANTVWKKELDGFREVRIGYMDENGAIGDVKREERVSVSHIEMMPVKGHRQ